MTESLSFTEYRQVTGHMSLKQQAVWVGIKALLAEHGGKLPPRSYDCMYIHKEGVTRRNYTAFVGLHFPEHFDQVLAEYFQDEEFETATEGEQDE